MEVKPLTSFNEIKKQYKSLSKKYHSDLIGDDERMKKINWAYEVLKEYILNYKFTFSSDEISKQYPDAFLQKYKV